jgi:hypothetical protein
MLVHVVYDWNMKNCKINGWVLYIDLIYKDAS